MKYRLLGLLALPVLAALCFAAAPNIEKHDVFVSGREGYSTYRIPAIIRAGNGDLLAFCEGRKNSRADFGDIDLLLKRSSDGGRTWSASQIIWDDERNTCGNPCPVLDESTGELLLLMTRNPGEAHEEAIVDASAAGSRTVWLTRSKDNGLSWTQPVEITASIKDPKWTWYATGPGIGIQLKHGPHAGRLLIPCDHKEPSAGTPIQGSHVIYSDDHGKTWRRGSRIAPEMNECQLAELFDGLGSVLMDMRSYRGRSRRAQARSSDGGETWSPAVDAEALVEPVCQAALLRHDGSGLLLFSNPAHPKKRARLTVKASSDNAKTWSVGIVLHAGPSAYSSLVALSSHEAGCLYENGEKGPYEKLTFARFEVRP